MSAARSFGPIQQPLMFGVVAPAATPKDIIAKLNREIVAVLAQPVGGAAHLFLQRNGPPIRVSAVIF